MSRQVGFSNQVLVTWPHVITWSGGYLTLRLSFSYHKPPPGTGFCRRGDILFSFCHVTSRDHVVKGSSDIVREFTILPSWWPQALFKTKYFVFILSCDLTWLSGQRFTWYYSFVIIGLLKEEDIKLSIGHVTSHDHVVRRSCDIIGEFCSLEVTPLLSLVITGFVEEEILSF